MKRVRDPTSFFKADTVLISELEHAHCTDYREVWKLFSSSGTELKKKSRLVNLTFFISAAFKGVSSYYKL